MNILHPPGHHFIDDSLGVFKTNSSVSVSNVAVVSKPNKLVPANKLILCKLIFECQRYF